MKRRPGQKMLIKEKDPADKAIQQLETIRQIPGLPKDTLAKVEKELKTLSAGNRGEADSAYFIDFYYATNRIGLSFTTCALNIAEMSLKSTT